MLAVTTAEMDEDVGEDDRTGVSTVLLGATGGRDEDVGEGD